MTRIVNAAWLATALGCQAQTAGTRAEPEAPLVAYVGDRAITRRDLFDFWPGYARTATDSGQQQTCAGAIAYVADVLATEVLAKRYGLIASNDAVETEYQRVARDPTLFSAVQIDARRNGVPARVELRRRMLREALRDYVGSRLMMQEYGATMPIPLRVVQMDYATFNPGEERQAHDFAARVSPEHFCDAARQLGARDCVQDAILERPVISVEVDTRLEQMTNGAVSGPLLGNNSVVVVRLVRGLHNVTVDEVPRLAKTSAGVGEWVQQVFVTWFRCEVASITTVVNVPRRCP